MVRPFSAHAARDWRCAARRPLCWGTALLGAAGLASASCIATRHVDRLLGWPQALPPPSSYPLRARYYLVRAVLAAPAIGLQMAFLERAMRAVLERGLGAISPQATAIVVYAAALACAARDVPRLVQSFEALTQKPHIGEGIAEERARLMASLNVADCILSLPPSSKEEVGVRSLTAEARRGYTRRSLEVIQKLSSPPFVPLGAPMEGAQAGSSPTALLDDYRRRFETRACCCDDHDAASHAS